MTGLEHPLPGVLEAGVETQDILAAHPVLVVTPFDWKRKVKQPEA
jgi:hypothetical protein